MKSFRDPASKQLEEFKEMSLSKKTKETKGKYLVDSLTIGPNGPMLLQDTEFIEEMSIFNRERIPERVVHAKGAGAYGYFKVTHGITHLTKAKIFSGIGKCTPCVVRFSSTVGEMGSADTVRDTRGFSIKFYTEEGIWDLVGSNFPIFGIRDPILYPSLLHSQKRNPVTHLRDSTMFWDFAAHRPETAHQLLILFSDRGIPNGFRHMNGYGVHAFKFVNEKNNAVYCKFHLKPDQRCKNLLPDEAKEVTKMDPDFFMRDLYNAIKMGRHPSWVLYIQIMTFQQAETWHFNPFDPTKIWPHSEFPLLPVGKLVLNENPNNYFEDIEKLAFSPSHLVPGIEPSPDKLLHGRIFAYTDSQRYRLGPNFLQIPANAPPHPVKNYEQDGYHRESLDYDGAPNYFPNSFNGPKDNLLYRKHVYSTSGDVLRYNNVDNDNFSQAAIFWERVLNERERQRLVVNLAKHMKSAVEAVQIKALKNFYQLNQQLGERLQRQLGLNIV